MRRYLPFAAAALLACSAGAADRSAANTRSDSKSAGSQRLDTASAAGALSGDTARASAGDQASTAGVRPASAADLPIVRGLYVNRFAAQSAKRMRKLIAIADS